jgi:ABC-type antimicrobial peptide transport system permease subunit
VGELALLRAVGYRTGALQALVLAETLLVLFAGLLVGVGAAVASVLPNLALGGSLPWIELAGLAAAVSAAGAVVAGLATAGVARAPLIPALRKD